MISGWALLSFLAGLYIYMIMSTYLYKPPEPDHEEANNEAYNTIIYAKQLILLDHWSRLRLQKGVGGWCFDCALRHGWEHYTGSKYAGFNRIVKIFEKAVPPPLGRPTGQTWYMDWEWMPERSQEDIIEILDKMAQLSKEE